MTKTGSWAKLKIDVKIVDLVTISMHMVTWVAEGVVHDFDLKFINFVHQINFKEVIFFRYILCSIPSTLLAENYRTNNFFKT